MYINFSNHSIDRCIERHPEIKKQKVKKYAIKEAKEFLEATLREWLSNAWKQNNQLRRKSDSKWKITITDWIHKIVYTKVEIWEILLITYGFKDENTLLEWEILKMLPNSYNKYKKGKYSNFN